MSYVCQSWTATRVLWHEPMCTPLTFFGIGSLSYTLSTAHWPRDGVPLSTLGELRLPGNDSEIRCWSPERHTVAGASYLIQSTVSIVPSLSSPTIQPDK